MLKDRRLWFLAPVLLALVILLGITRARSFVPPADSPASVSPRAAVPADPVSTSPVDDETSQPRHPQIGFRTSELLDQHFRKHGREFHVKTAAAYLRLAQLLRDRPKSSDVLQFVRNDAVTCKFDRETGSFIAYDSDGTIRTFFRPTDGEAYFERQKSRSHENP